MLGISSFSYHVSHKYFSKLDVCFLIQDFTLHTSDYLNPVSQYFILV